MTARARALARSGRSTTPESTPLIDDRDNARDGSNRDEINKAQRCGTGTVGAKFSRRLLSRRGRRRRRSLRKSASEHETDGRSRREGKFYRVHLYDIGGGSRRDANASCLRIGRRPSATTFAVTLASISGKRLKNSRYRNRGEKSESMIGRERNERSGGVIRRVEIRRWSRPPRRVRSRRGWE